VEGTTDRARLAAVAEAAASTLQHWQAASRLNRPVCPHTLFCSCTRSRAAMRTAAEEGHKKVLIAV
jgi:hypothetical protein